MDSESLIYGFLYAISFQAGKFVSGGLIDGDEELLKVGGAFGALALTVNALYQLLDKGMVGSVDKVKGDSMNLLLFTGGVALVAWCAEKGRWGERLRSWTQAMLGI